MILILGIIIGIVVGNGLRCVWITFQLRELERRAGLLRSKEINCQPGKWGKRFKYLHNFLIQTRLHLRAQLFNLKQTLLEFCLKHNLFHFKSTPLGKCLQSRVDLETDIFGETDCLVFFHKSFFLEFKDYLFSITHPDPVIYGLKGGGKGKWIAGSVNFEHSID